MNVEKTSEIQAGDNLVMVVYGKGGVGKTTFTASAPDVLLLDFENGSKYLGDRGIDIDVIRFKEWIRDSEKKELAKIIAPYKTIALDPLGEAMEKLLTSPSLNTKKYRQSDGSLTIAGWGEAKAQMRSLIKWLRDSGKNVIIVAHVSEEKDGEQLINRIQVATKLREEIPNIVDIISYLGVRMIEGRAVRVLYTPRQGDQFDSKDRTGRIPPTVQISEKDGFNDLLHAMGMNGQTITIGETVEPLQEEVPHKEPHEDGRKKLTRILDDSLLDGLITKEERTTVLDNSKKYSGAVLAKYTAKITDHLNDLRAEKTEKETAESMPDDTIPVPPVEEPQFQELEIW